MLCNMATSTGCKFLALCRRLSSGRALQAGIKWRESQGESRTGYEYGSLVDLPDWEYADGRPAPLGAGRLKRMQQQRELAERIDRLSAEMNTAIQKEKNAAKLAQTRQHAINQQKLKPKRQSIKKSKDATQQDSH